MKYNFEELFPKISTPLEMMRYKIMVEIADHLSFALNYLAINSENANSNWNMRFKLIDALYNYSWMAFERYDTNDIFKKPFVSISNTNKAEFLEFSKKWTNTVFISEMNMRRRLNLDGSVWPNFEISLEDKCLIGGLKEFKQLCDDNLLSEENAEAILLELQDVLPNSRIFRLNEGAFTITKKDGTDAPTVNLDKKSKEFKLFELFYNHWLKYGSKPLSGAVINAKLGFSGENSKTYKYQIEKKFAGLGIPNVFSAVASNIDNGAYVVNFVRP